MILAKHWSSHEIVLGQQRRCRLWFKEFVTTEETGQRLFLFLLQEPEAKFNRWLRHSWSSSRRSLICHMLTSCLFYWKREDQVKDELIKSRRSPQQQNSAKVYTMYGLKKKWPGWLKVSASMALIGTRSLPKYSHVTRRNARRSSKDLSWNSRRIQAVPELMF